MAKKKRVFFTSVGMLFFLLSFPALPVKGETMPDMGSAPLPYPDAATFNQQYEYLGDDSHKDDGVSFSPAPGDWAEGEKVKVRWHLTTTDEKKFYLHGVYFRLYIDWNHDGDWDDDGEMVIDSFKDKIKGKHAYKFKDSFVVPKHNHESNFWARAWVSYGVPSPVFGDESTSFGEIEDYNLLSYEDPTAVTLVSFTAREADGKIILKWDTATEVDNAGFNVYRADSEGGSYVQINDTLIPAKGSAVSGASYRFQDASGTCNSYYKLEDLDNSGNKTLHGPVTAKNKTHKVSGPEWQSDTVYLPVFLSEIAKESKEF
ncbi:MAG: hypothetical protein HUU08_16290 [Candidatus Brocadia sp.]|nr:hypothetical protein [Candidatus Brocadia sp.]